MNNTVNHNENSEMDEAKLETYPWRITFDTNPDDCNMSCIMCEEHSIFSPLRRNRILNNEPHRRMDFEIIKKTVNEMVKNGLVEIIPSTMGEPLLYENFEDIVNLCKETGVRLNLTTNGTWPRLGPEKWARLICEVTSDVKISWNGATKNVQESIMKGSPFDKRLNDLRAFIATRDMIAESTKKRCRITLQCTFLETNVNELPDILNMAIDLGVDRVKGHQLWVNFPEIAGLDMRRSKESIERWNGIVDQCNDIVNIRINKYGNHIILDNFNKLEAGSPGIMPGEWECPFLGKEAWVNYKGDFNPCCAPDAERKKLGSFGNVMEIGGMEAIWKSPSYRNLLRTYRTNSICKKCNMRKPFAKEGK